MKKNSVLLIVQAVYYLLTGLWPLLHLNSFLSITGSGADLWRSQPINLLILCVGLVLLRGSAEKSSKPATNILSVAAAFVLLIIDLYFPFSGVVSKLYVVDGILQFSCLVLWLCVLIKRPIPLYRF